MVFTSPNSIFTRTLCFSLHNGFRLYLTYLLTSLCPFVRVTASCCFLITYHAFVGFLNIIHTCFSLFKRSSFCGPGLPFLSWISLYLMPPFFSFQFSLLFRLTQFSFRMYICCRVFFFVICGKWVDGYCIVVSTLYECFKVLCRARYGLLSQPVLYCVMVIWLVIWCVGIQYSRSDSSRAWRSRVETPPPE